MLRLTSFLLLLLLASAPQQTKQGGGLRRAEQPEPLENEPPQEPTVLWVSGDTHEHLQSCLGHARPLEEIIARMEAEQIQVGNVLIWNPGDEGDSYTRFSCLVTGEPDELSTPQLILQYGVETSGLDCDKWGHLMGLGIGPDEASIAAGSLADGDCADMPGLGLGCAGGDGTGVLNWPVAEHFFEAPGAAVGYAHSIWTLGLYRANGYDWVTNLVENGYGTDILCLDTERTLAIPNLAKLIDDSGETNRGTSSLLHGDLQRAFFPLLGAVDAVLGDAQFFETTTLTPVFPLPFSPAANWYGLYYKLLSAGLHVGLSGGSDEACPIVGVTEFPLTYVWLDEPLTYAAWIRGLAAGHTTVGVPGLRIDLRVKDRRVGQEVHLTAQEIAASVAVEVVSAAALDDHVELIIAGEVAASQPVTLAEAGTAKLSFDGVPFPESAWVAVRLRSQRAHTGAIYVISDDRPIAGCESAEYWMLWCDILTKKALETPELEIFGCQEAAALERIAHARRAFKSYRDLDGFDPSWMVERFGRSTPGSRGPIAIGTSGPARTGDSLRLTCLNAPPLADGVVYLSRARDPAGPCDGDVRLFVKTDPASLIATFPAHATRSGYAEVLIPSLPAGEFVLHAQFVWTNPPGSPSFACGGGVADRSASDALTLDVQVPDLVSLEVTPTNPSMALGTSTQFTAMGVFSDKSTQDLTDLVTWSSSVPAVAEVSNAPGTHGLAASATVGSTTVTAMDEASGIDAATTLTVTPAVLLVIEVTPTNPSIALGTGVQFTAIGVFSDGSTQDLTGTAIWSSSSPTVATVSNALGSQGLATSVAVGATTITATESGISGATTLTVTPAVLVSLAVTPTNPSIALGTNAQFTAMGTYTDGTTQDLTAAVTWSSSDPFVAIVSNAPGSQGLTKSLSVGSTTITATETASGISGTTLLTVSPAALVTIEVTPTNPSIPLGTFQQFTAIGTYTNGTTQDLTSTATWSSSSPGVATVSNAPKSRGFATSVSVGSTTIAATDSESSIGGATTLDVTPAVLVALAVTPTNPSIPLGTFQQFTAIGTYSDDTTQDLTGAVTWSSASPSVATVSNAPASQGLATSVAVGTTTITATDPESSVSGATTLDVTPAILVSLAVTPINPSIPLGTFQQFTALGTYTDATTQDLTATVTWSSSSPGVATISNAPKNRGFATSVAVGSTTITAVEPESSISGATTLTVTPAILVSIAVTPIDPSIPLGTFQQFTAVGTYSDATTQDLTLSATWSSSSPSVATISNAPGSQGLATSVALGTTTLTATDPESSISGATTLDVTPAILVSIAVTPIDATIGLGTSRQFTALGTYTDGSTQDLTTAATWSSSSPAVATVSNAPGSQGLATSVSVGTTTITAIDPASGISGATTLTVKAVLLSIQVTPASAVIVTGSTRQYTATGTFNDGTTQNITALVFWSSSKPNVATISNTPGTNGIATGLSAGLLTITATDLETGVFATASLRVLQQN